MFSFFRRKPKVVIRHRAEHPISRKNISREALKVLYRLSDAGYKAYLVGGGVRDLLLGRTPKDFDVGTDASPREIKRLFPRCFLIGRRFRLAHVVFGKTIIETSTFRGQPPPAEEAEESGIGELYQDDDNTFGTPEEDARRRDFTINGLFYDIKTFDVIDYVGGLADLEAHVLRAIGDPDIRFQEDPVRMMRAIRLSAKLGMEIERKTYKAICRQYREIEKASTPRVFEEICRLFSFSAAEKSFRLMWRTRLLTILTPSLCEFIDTHGGEDCDVWKYLREFDRITKGWGEEASNGLRFAALYMAPYLAALKAQPGRYSQSAASVLHVVNERYRMSKAIHIHTTHILGRLSFFEKGASRGRFKLRPGNAEFKDTITLARIRAAADGLPTGPIEAAVREANAREAALAAHAQATATATPAKAANDANGVKAANNVNGVNGVNGANGVSDVSGANGANDVSGATGVNDANDATSPDPAAQGQPQRRRRRRHYRPRRGRSDEAASPAREGD